MFVVRSLFTALLIGPLAVPAHWCCALELDEKPCCQAAKVETGKPTSPCCRAAKKHETTVAVRSSHPSPDARPCCCRATEPTIPTAKLIAPQDGLQATADAFLATVIPAPTILVAIDALSTPPPEPMQARLCCWRC
jgi:hypothetical protein